MKRLLLIAAAFLLPLAGPARAADTARARLDAFAGGLHSLTGRFTQTLSGGEGQAPKTSSGTLALEAPRQFRWETTAPYRQTIVADGSRVWLYDPELEQVTVRVQSTEEAHSPLTVITDLRQLDRDFKVTEQGERDGLLWLRLTSTAKDPQFDYADLGFDEHGLARMSFRDQLGAVTDIRFSGWQRNAPVPPGTFEFTPPKGADVIGDLPVITTRPLKD
ncbi:outer membrane lipoprotein chaperone LolA [Fulvimonas soli]|jgi:outer membrane lipoprotein carrier protein|uniref:Outer-membrane lipoprotein carrier protein n=1 Tax=Fulvimonas soli TaxID=155197 RepID=A0A316I8P1_9GAMM|nr:outer membrane lipoprotein chaperone LolA [Fulvimonas soli]PWK89813.1 outer membrane lipoprotein carrier protein [Fulvimonas soli]TNY27549.1 outer membrane lipoprotein carrier protein LolA [Fulvimonas soli]